MRYCLKESGRQKRKSRERCPHRPADLPEDSNFLGQPCQNRPAKFARTSLSAWGLPTPAVAFACIGNVDIQVFSGVGGRLYFIRRLQVYLFIIFHVQPISQGVTLLFFFTEKKKRSKKRKEFAFHLYCKIPISPEDIAFSINKTSPAGHTGGCRRNTTLFTVEIGA